MIQDIWEYSRSIWKIRNAVVHGARAEEARAKNYEELCRLLDEEYTLFWSNNFIVNAAFRSLFTKRTLEERKGLSNDSIEAWLRSVQAAKQYQKVFQASLKRSASKFFTSKKKTTVPNPASKVGATPRAVHCAGNTDNSDTNTPSGAPSTSIQFEEIDPG